MKEQKKVKKLLYIIIVVLILIGAVICKTKGFNIELGYSNRQQIVLSNNTGLDEAKIKEMVKSVIKDRNVNVQKIERFGNSVQITSNTISEEEKENIITKVNEEYGCDISNEEIKIIDISNTRIRDILKPYILPGIITLVTVLLYFIIVYHNIGINKLLIKGICIPILTQLVYYSLIAITRIPFGRVVNSIAIGLYIINIAAITICFNKEKEKSLKIEKKEND